MAASATRCAHHPDRPGHALCMACRKVVCAECATDWEGINYCATCLAGRRAAASSGARLPGWLALTAVSLTLLLLAVRLMVWTGVLLASLG
jgi:hypothetical protein